MIASLLSQIASFISQALAVFWTILKFMLILTLAYTFYVAIQSLVSFISQLVLTSVVGEFFALVSMYLPFNANTIFGAIISVCNAILAFVIARKIWNMYKELFVSAN